MTSTKILEMIQNGLLPVIHEDGEVVGEPKNCWCCWKEQCLSFRNKNLKSSFKNVVFKDSGQRNPSETAKYIRICWLTSMYLRVLFSCRSSVC